LFENAITIFYSRLFPGFAEYFPGSETKNPGYLPTGICPQPIDEIAAFSGPNGLSDAESTRFPVIFPVHGNPTGIGLTIAQGIVFLASNDAGFMTAPLVVDGGITTR
jgi:hypothetical protein